MRAYLHGVRDFNDALDGNGRLSGDKGEAIVAILTEYTAIKDPDFFRKLKFASLQSRRDAEYRQHSRRSRNLEERRPDRARDSAERAIDTSFLDAALKVHLARIGPRPDRT